MNTQTEGDEMAKTIALRASIAGRIRKLSQEWAENTLELGHEFCDARATFPDRGCKSEWHAWVSANTDFSLDHVGRFMRIYERLGNQIPASTPGIKLTMEVLRYLAQGNVPVDGVKEVIKRVQKGEEINHDKAKEIVKQHLPSRKEAIKQARETGKLVAARDGHMYSGASEDEMLAYSERRKIVYAIRRAVDEIADCTLTPQQWVNSAEDHWVHEFKLSHVESAIEFLTKLEPLLSERQKVVSNGTR